MSKMYKATDYVQTTTLCMRELSRRLHSNCHDMSGTASIQNSGPDIRTATKVLKPGEQSHSAFDSVWHILRAIACAFLELAIKFVSTTETSWCAPLEKTFRFAVID